MSWLYSQALVAAYLEGDYSDGTLSALLKSNPIPQAFCAPDKMTAFSRLSRFGMTFAPLTEDRGAELLMSFLADFRVKTSVPQAAEQESTERAVDSGAKWHESSVKYDLTSSLWKTHHCLWEEVLPWSSVILPRWGMTRNGFVFQHPTSERPISAIGSGLWQTPVADDACNRKAGEWNSRGEPKLSAQVLFATPQARDYRSGQASRWNNPARSRNLNDQIAKFPTPATRDYKGARKPESMALTGRNPQTNSLPDAVEFQNGENGRLNPEWVEWLMGWPLGWTDLKPLAMDKFREWQQQHSKYFQAENE